MFLHEESQMLEACVDKRTGDILVVKPQGAPWGSPERDGPALAVVTLDDRQTEQRLQEHGQASGEAQAVMAYPYAAYETDENDPEAGQHMVEVSLLKADPAKVERGAVVRHGGLVENLADFEAVKKDG